MRKLKGMAVTSFVFGLFFWLPLLNVILGILAIILGVKARRLVLSEPDKYGGKTFAIIGIILGGIPILFSIVGLMYCFAGYSEICRSMGLWFIA